LGHIDEARRAAEHALVIDATVPAYYNVLIQTGDARRNANAVAALQQLAKHEAVLDGHDRAILHFLLAKAFEDQERYDVAFAEMDAANAIKRGMIDYDEARELGRMDLIAAEFSAERLEALAGSGDSTPGPVFVVGMPRSGTTLVEQILASHPDAFGAGELTFLPDLVAAGAAGENFPADFAAITPKQLQQLGETYRRTLTALAPAAKVIVDKQPLNFLLAGLIYLAMPGARIVHVRRDPLDTCLSCYATSFAGEIGWAYEMGELGRYYRAYERLMRHWRAVLPQTAMIDVHYEALVEDLPSQARRLVEACGLGWDARCLDFHKTPRTVATASLAQVRRPIYRSSVQRSAIYADHLLPLRQALDLP
jgi:hypothetical protein